MKRLALLTAFVTAIWSTAPLAAETDAATGPYALRSKRAEGDVDFVQAALNVGGDLKILAEKKVERLKMSVEAGFTYHEKMVATPSELDGQMASIRYYGKADAVLKTGEDSFSPALRDERFLIGVQAMIPEIKLFSPNGSLTGDELELIDLPGNSLLLDRLLPIDSVNIDDSWPHNDGLVAALLCLDAVTTSEVQSKLIEVTDGVALVEMAGTVEGAEGGIGTKVQVMGKYQFDLDQGRIVWLGLLVKEDRAIGHIETGFDVVARLQMRITPGQESEHLTDDRLKDVSTSPTSEQLALAYRSAAGHWRLEHDRRWFIFTDEESDTLLRLIDKGEFLAQCRISMLPEGSAKKEVTLERFQADIKQAMGESFTQFAQASEQVDQRDCRIYRVAVLGTFAQMQIEWIYYLLTDPQGKQVALIFSVEQELIPRFGRSDHALVDKLRLTRSQVAAKPQSGSPGS